MSTLKPCPFCGCDDIATVDKPGRGGHHDEPPGAWVKCNGCGARTAEVWQTMELEQACYASGQARPNDAAVRLEMRRRAAVLWNRRA